MALRDILGHSKQILQLRGVIKSGHVPHAYLFSGVEGVGKRLLAENFARILNCQNPVNPQEALDSCDECVSCKKIINRTHPDVKLIEPDEEYIKVEQLRDVLRDVSFKPYEGRWKIFIFDNAESLLPAAANLFLKTLEEPNQRTLFILISSRPELLLPTVISRCQRIRFGGIPSNIIFDVLKRELKLSDEETRFYALASEGSIGRGKSLLAGELKNISESYLTEIHKFVFSADLDSSSGVEQLFSLTEKLSQNKESLPLIMELIRLWYRDLIIWKGTGEEKFLLNRSHLKEIKQQTSKISIEELFRRVDIVEKMNIAFDYNTNKQLTLDTMFVESLASREARCL